MRQTSCCPSLPHQAWKPSGPAPRRARPRTAPWSGELREGKMSSFAAAWGLIGVVKKWPDRAIDVAQVHRFAAGRDVDLSGADGCRRFADRSGILGAIIEAQERDHVVLVDAVARNADG